MAKYIAKAKSMEESLWNTANKLRGSVEPSEYKHVVLCLIFLKYASDRFTERYNLLVKEGKGDFVDQEVFYNAVNVFYLAPESRWKYIIENAKQNDIASNYHNWQRKGFEETYHNESEYCYSASLDEIAAKNYSLVPSKYIEFKNRDEQEDFDTKMKKLQAELSELFKQEEESKKEVLKLFKELGYGIE